jgi:hypothetical protein
LLVEGSWAREIDCSPPPPPARQHPLECIYGTLASRFGDIKAIRRETAVFDLILL